MSNNFFVLVRKNYSDQAAFIRVAPDASPMHIKQLLFPPRRQKVTSLQFLTKRFEHVRLQPPSLVISITGSVKEYSMKSKLFRVFRQGFLKMAKTTGWLYSFACLRWKYDSSVDFRRCLDYYQWYEHRYHKTSGRYNSNQSRSIAAHSLDCKSLFSVPLTLSRSSEGYRTMGMHIRR